MSNDERLQSYIIKKFNDAMFVSSNIKEVMESTDKELFEDPMYLSELLEVLNEMQNNQIYPESAIKNIGILLDNIKSNTDLVNILRIKYDIVKDMEPSNKFYMNEYYNKFYSMRNKNKYDQNEVVKSVIYDHQTLIELIDQDRSIKENPYYVYSIKKILIEFPEIFLDKRINEKAIKILEKNINEEPSKRLINKIKHIDKYNSLMFDPINFKSMYYYVVTQNMMVNECNIEDIIYSDTSYGVNYITDFVYSMIDNELIYNESTKKSIADIMYVLRNYNSEKLDRKEYRKFLEKYNDHLGKLNGLEINPNLYFDTEYELRTKGFDRIKYLFKPLYTERLILNDLEILNMYIVDEEEFKEKKEEYKNNDKIYLSINKFLNINPTMFDDEIIKERTLELLNNRYPKNKILSKKIKKNYKY